MVQPPPHLVAHPPQPLPLGLLVDLNESDSSDGEQVSECGSNGSDDTTEYDSTPWTDDEDEDMGEPDDENTRVLYACY